MRIVPFFITVVFLALALVSVSFLVADSLGVAYTSVLLCLEGEVLSMFSTGHEATASETILE